MKNAKSISNANQSKEGLKKSSANQSNEGLKKSLQKDFPKKSRIHLYSSIDYDKDSISDQKKSRGKIRSRLSGFMKDILGKDRSDQERRGSIKGFKKFYKENFSLNDFSIESLLSSRKNGDQIQDYKDMLIMIKSFK